MPHDGQKWLMLVPFFGVKFKWVHCCHTRNWKNGVWLLVAFAKAGHKVLLGSRETSKAQEAAKKIPDANINARKPKNCLCPQQGWLVNFSQTGWSHRPLLSWLKKIPKNIQLSDDKEALDRVVALIQSTGYPIGKSGPLVGARDDEVALHHWLCKT